MTKRNIIVISLDEVRPGHLSCYGYKKISTFMIDEVAIFPTRLSLKED